MAEPNPLPACLSHMEQRDAELIARARSAAFIEASAFHAAMAAQMIAEALRATTGAETLERRTRAREHRLWAHAMLERAQG